jgi:hypothetical protein
MPATHPLPEHRFGDGQPWSIWRDFALRGTGFEVSLLDSLASPELGAATMHGLLEGSADAWQTLERTWQAADQAALQQLRALAADARFREAVAWQNPAAVATGLNALLRAALSGRRNAQDRQHERLVARYLQRYAGKNDTVGFFGPVGWGRIDGPSGGLQARQEGALAHSPAVRLEPWAVQALATAITADAALRPLLRPRRHPSWRPGPDGSVVVLERALRLPPLEQRLFAGSDGRHTLASLARPGDDAAELALAWGRLEQGQLVNLQLPVPLDGPALHNLRQAVAELPADGSPQGAASQARWLATLDGLLAGVDAATAAFGDAAAVQAAQASLAEAFRAATQVADTRLPGQAYAGRTLVCLDSRRGLSLQVPETEAHGLLQALRPVLQAAHWYSCQVHQQLTEFTTGLFQRHQQRGLLPLDRLWLLLQQEGATLGAIVDDVAEQLAERWATVLPAQGDEPAADEVARRAAAAFADAAPGWPGARFQAPDVMRAATALDDPDAFYVLGELHAADRSLLRQVFVDQHPDPARLRAAAAHDQPEPELRPVMRTEGLLARTRVLADAPWAFDIECDSVFSPQPPGRVLRSGALWVQQRGDGLHIVDRERGLDFPLSAFLGPQAGALSSGEFRLYAPAAHRPRRTAGRLVVAREAWQVPLAPLAAELGAASPNSFDAYAATRRAAHRHGWPRQVFYRLAGEPKPLFLDLDSTAFVSLFLRLLAAAARRGDPVLDVSEMLPGPSHCGLPGAEGSRHASEWRLLCVR